MDKMLRVLITLVIVAVLIMGLYYFTDWFSKVTGYFSGEDEKIVLAQCLSEKGAEFYGSEYCADCEKQANLLGKGFSLVSHIDCGKNMEKCPNLRSIPAFYVNENVYYGLKNISELRDISNCKSKEK